MKCTGPRTKDLGPGTQGNYTEDNGEAESRHPTGDVGTFGPLGRQLDHFGERFTALKLSWAAAATGGGGLPVGLPQKKKKRKGGS